MFASSQFDGNAAFSGGGFMPSQATQDATASSSSSGKKREIKGLLPQTVKQMIEDTMWISDGAAVENVTLVGKVSNKVDMLAAIRYTLDDGTGRVKCTQWMNENLDEDWDVIDVIQDGMYIEALGEFRGFYGTGHFIPVHARPVTDFNEIAYHFPEYKKVKGGAPSLQHRLI